MGPQATDRDLLEALRQGDRLAFSELYHRYARHSLLEAARAGAGADAHDVVQDVWVALFRRPPVLSTNTLRPWLTTAIRHRALRVARRRPETMRTSLVGTATSPSRGVARAELRMVVVEAHRRGDLTDLDVEQLLGVGVSPRQLAERDCVEQGSVRMRASRALSKLRRLALEIAGL